MPQLCSPESKLTLRSYRFGPFLLDRDRVELRKHGSVISIEPKTFDLISYLIEHRDRVVPKRELITQLWPTEVVSEGSLAHCVLKARKALGDVGGQQAVIRTIRKRGYRLLTPVEAVSVNGSSGKRAIDEQRDEESPKVAPSDLIGRQEQLARLTAAWRRARSGRGALVLVTGEAGIGKTALVRAALQHWQAEGGCVFLAHCHETEGAPPYWPWLQLLRHYLNTTAVEDVRQDIGGGAGDLAHLLPELDRVYPNLQPVADLDATESRFRLFDSVATLLARCARRGLAAHFIDDIHWADEASILLLSHVAREAETAPVLIVATCRDDYRISDHPAPERAWHRLLSEPTVEHVALKGLVEADVAALIERSEGSAASREQVNMLQRVTAGNPFFVRELLQAGIVNLARDAASASFGAEAATSRRVQQALLRRLGKLSAEARRALAAASIVGPRFSARSLATLLERPVESIAEVLDEARAGGSVEAIGDEFQFPHELYRDALRAELGVTRRAQLHRRMGELLEQQRAQTGTVSCAEIAYHFCEAAVAGEGREALDYAIRAADEAEAAMSYEEAADRYRLALRMSEQTGGVDRRRRAELLMRHAISLFHCGSEQPARERILQAATLAAEIGATDLLVQSALHYSGTGPYRRVMRAQGIADRQHVDLLERALAALPPASSSSRARVAAELAAALQGADEENRSKELMSQALAHAAASGEPTTLAAVLAAKQATLSAPHLLAERLALTEQLIPLARKIGAAALEAEARWTRAIALAEQGDLGAADVEMATVAELADVVRLPVLRWLVAAWWLARAMLRGHVQEAERQFRAIEETFTGRFVRSDEALAGQRSHLRVLTGLGEDVLPELEELVKRFPRTPAWRARLAAVYALCGRTADARAEFELIARCNFSQLPHDDTRMGCLYHLTLACGLIMDSERASQLYDLLKPYGERVVYIGGFAALGGSVSMLLGILAAVKRDWPIAQRHFEQSLADNQRTGALAPICLTELIYGRLLAKRRDPRGQAMLVRCKQRADSMGLSYQWLGVLPI